MIGLVAILLTFFLAVSNFVVACASDVHSRFKGDWNDFFKFFFKVVSAQRLLA